MREWNFYTSNEIKPSGWLRRQLEIQASGLSGNLDKVWRDIRDSAWIGGDAEGWERVPYWLDGFIPLAYLLEDDDLINRAKKYINAIISARKPDGWLCPCSDEEREAYDTWAVILITKTLTVYYECSKDERIPRIIYDALKNYYDLLKSGKIKLFQWGEFRWYECFISINFTYQRYPENWLCELGSILKEQGMDYNTISHMWERPLNKWQLTTHVVNMAMALKYEAVSADILGEKYTDDAEKIYQQLYKHNGTPVGIITGDECLSGLSPIQGSELCSVVELMYSFEQLYAYTGDSKWAERLELVAFNALPATLSDDMWSHQYVQMSNQIACIKFPGKSLFRTNNSEAHIFGLEPHFGCCTSNFSQGWTKLALSAFMHNGKKIKCTLSVPSTLDCSLAHIELETNYPFENSFKYTIKALKDFTFEIRIPSFAENISIDSVLTNDNEPSFEIKSGEEKEINISFDTTPHFEQRPHELNVVKSGSLVFSVPVKYEKKMYEYEKDGVERKYPYCDWEYIPASDWSFAYCSNSMEITENGVSEIPFSSEKPPVTIKTQVKKINWGLEDGYETVCSKIPESTEPLSEAEEITLHPYGCAKLRMTELPLID